MIIVYFSVNDKDRNSEMRKAIKKTVQENEEALVGVGYFNRRVCFKGQHVLDTNAIIVLEWKDKCDLMINLKGRGELQRKHLEVAFGMEARINHVSEEIVHEDRARKCLKRIKGGKVPGMDGLKFELVKSSGKTNR